MPRKSNVSVGVRQPLNGNGKPRRTAAATREKLKRERESGVSLDWADVTEPGPCEGPAIESPDVYTRGTIADSLLKFRQGQVQQAGRDAADVDEEAELDPEIGDEDDEDVVVEEEDFVEEEGSPEDEVEFADDIDEPDKPEDLKGLEIIKGPKHGRVLINSRIALEFGYPQAAIVGWISCHQCSDDKRDGAPDDPLHHHSNRTSGCKHKGLWWIYDTAADLAGKIGMTRDTFFRNLAELKKRRWVEHIGKPCCKVTSTKGTRFWTRKPLYRVNIDTITQWCEGDGNRPDMRA